MKVGLEVRISLVCVLSTGGGEASRPPPKKKSFSCKKLKAISISDDDIKESVKAILMSINAISANPEHYLYKIFLSSMPRTCPTRPDKIF